MNQSIETIQTLFTQFITNTDNEDNLAFVSSDNAGARCQIYKQAIRSNLIKALSLTFPGIWALLGEECANAVAYRYLQRAEHFPCTGCLDDWGGDFPLYFQRIPELEHLPYLKEYAEYEWRYLQSFKAAEVEMIAQAAMLERLQNDDHTIWIDFVPSFQLMVTQYPIHQIQHVILNMCHDQINISVGEYHYVLYRTSDAVALSHIAAELWYFLNTLDQNASLQFAIDNTSANYPNFDLVNALNYILTTEIVANVSSEDSKQRGKIC